MQRRHFSDFVKIFFLEASAGVSVPGAPRKEKKKHLHLFNTHLHIIANLIYTYYLFKYFVNDKKKHNFFEKKGNVAF